MKRQINKWLSIILITILVFSAIPMYSAAEEGTDDVVSGTAVLQEYDGDNGEGEPLESEVPFVEGDAESAELKEDEVVNNLNITNGLPETAAADETDGEIAAGTGETADETINDFVFEGDTKEETAENKATGAGYETNASSPYLTLSSSSITINTGSSSRVTVGYGGYSGSVYLQYGRSNSNVNCSWGSWSNGKNPLTITGISSGTTTVYVYLKAASNNKTLASRTISITVKNTVQLSLSRTSFDTVYGKTTPINVTVSGVNSSMKLKYSVTSGNSVSCAWSRSWSGSTTQLNIKGTGTGISKVTVYVLSSSGSTLRSATVTIYVTRSASLSASSGSLKLFPGQKHTNTISYSGAYGTLHMTFSLSNSNVSCSWGSWSGNRISLFTWGKKNGGSTITVRLYNSSNDVLATRTISASTIDEAKLDCNVSSLSLTAGGSKKISYTFSGTSATVYYSYSIGNSSICSANWYGSWNGNSHALTVYAKNPGKTTLTVYLKNANTNATLASKSITVTVTGQPEITLSVSSVSVKVGQQASIVATAKNISGTYSMSYGTSGGNYSAYWATKIVNNQATLGIKGTKSGSGTLTVYLKNASGTVVSQKSIKVTTSSDENPSISFSSSSVSVKEKTSQTITVSYSGTSDTIYMSFSRSNSNASAKWGNWNKSSIPLTITGNTIGSTTITVYLKRASNNQVMAQKNISVTITADASEVSRLSYNFDNYSAQIPLSTFKLMYGDNTKAEQLFNTYHNAGGVCYGMAASSMLLRGGAVSTSTFGKSSIWNLSKLDNSSALGMRVTTFIESMYISQFSTVKSSNSNYNLNTLTKKVENGERILISITGMVLRNGQYESAGHAVVGYKLDKVNNRLYIYDSNHPGTERYITLYGTFGNYTGWMYNLFGSTTWGSSYQNGRIYFQPDSSVTKQWSDRGKLKVASGWLTNASLLITNSNSFDIYDFDGNLYASYSNGVLEDKGNDIDQIVTCSFNPYEEDFGITEYEAFYLPKDYYRIKNKDAGLEIFEAEMIDEELGVAVKTEGDELTLAADDSFDLCSTNLSLAEGDFYDVTLLSSRAGEEDIQITGIATKDTKTVGLSMIAGVFTNINAEGANIISLGTSGNENVTVQATCTEGGKITPDGSSKTIRGNDLTFKISPDSGYEIIDVIVNEESVGIVSEYTFVRIDKDSTIEAVFSKKEQEKPKDISLAVQKPSSTVVKYGDTLVLHAKASDIPENYHIEWYVDGSGVQITPSEDGMACSIKSVSSGKVTVTAKVVNKNGKVYTNSDGTEVKDEQSLTSKAGFFWKVISFFKNLFRISRIIAQSVTEE